MYKRVLFSRPLKLFDVTLRDGLQSIPKIYSLKEKKQLFEDIITNKFPSSIEIGSIVSPKILPQMENSLELFNYANSFKSVLPQCLDIYMLTPNYKSLEVAINKNIENFSFITSVSDEFQKKNINKSLTETKKELEKMIEKANTVNESKIKLYISCISECPISGQINTYKIVDEIMNYFYTYECLNEICLSDTCGTLRFTDFKFILDSLINRNVDIDLISLHLHKQKNDDNLTNILIYAMNYGIYRYDVSYKPDIGGCSVTMENTHGNLSYQQIYNLF